MMPKMFHLEPYDECFIDDVKFSENSYCIVDVYITANKSSELWRTIERNSKPWKTQYRHNHLLRGVCMNRCKQQMAKFDKMTQKKYFSPKPRNFSEATLDPFRFHHAVEDKLEFEELANECINYNLKKSHQLQAFSEIQYCDIRGRVDELGNAIKTFGKFDSETFLITDQLDGLFIVLIGFIASLVAVSTFSVVFLHKSQFYATFSTSSQLI